MSDAGPVQNAAAFDEELTDAQRWAATGVVMLAMVMSIVDSSIVNVALPHMMGTFGVGIRQIAWVVTGYTLANVIVIPLSAWLASIFGRARLFNGAVIAFTLSSVFCGLAPSLGLMVAARVLQGLSAGLLMPLGQAILYEAFPPEKRGASMAVFGMGVMVGPAIGPTLGGWITDTFSWPWIFYINLPVGVVAALLVPMFIKDPPYLQRRVGGGDLIGVVLLASGIGLMQYLLEEGSADGWFEADWVVLATAASLVILGAFVVWEWLHPDPAVDLRVLSDANFRSTMVINVIVGVGLMGAMFLLPVYIQNVLGLTATQTGLVLMPGAVATAASMSISGKLTDRGYTRSQVLFGLCVFTLSMWMMSRLTADASMADLMLPQVARGVGLGFTFVPLSVIAVKTMPKPQMGQATGLINLTRRLGGSMGVAWLAVVLDDARVDRVQWLAGHVDPYNPVARQQLEGMSGALTSQGAAGADHAALLGMYGRVARAASDMSFNHAFFIVALLFLGSMPFLLLLRGHKPAPAVTEE